VVAKRARVEQHDRDLSFAWHIAALSRQEKLPSLRKVLSRPSEQKQTPEQMRAQVRVVSEQFGLRLKTKKKRKGA
jgi:hypothetical protein